MDIVCMNTLLPGESEKSMPMLMLSANCYYQNLQHRTNYGACWISVDNGKVTGCAKNSYTHYWTGKTRFNCARCCGMLKNVGLTAVRRFLLMYNYYLKLLLDCHVLVSSLGRSSTIGRGRDRRWLYNISQVHFV